MNWRASAQFLGGMCVIGLLVAAMVGLEKLLTPFIGHGLAFCAVAGVLVSVAALWVGYIER